MTLPDGRCDGCGYVGSDGKGPICEGPLHVPCRALDGEQPPTAPRMEWPPYLWRWISRGTWGVAVATGSLLLLWPTTYYLYPAWGLSLLLAIGASFCDES